MNRPSHLHRRRQRPFYKLTNSESANMGVQAMLCGWDHSKYHCQQEDWQRKHESEPELALPELHLFHTLVHPVYLIVSGDNLGSVAYVTYLFDYAPGSCDSGNILDLQETKQFA